MPVRLTIMPVRVVSATPVISNVEELTYEVYCTVLQSMDPHRELALSFKFPTGIAKFFKDLKTSVEDLAEEFGVGFTELLKSLQQRDVFAIIKAVGFNLKTIWKAISLFTSLIPKGLIGMFKAMERNGVFQKLRDGLISVDALLSQYPLLKKLSGLALAGFLLYAWLNMSFIGSLDFDMDISVIAAALKGSYGLADLLASPDGLAMLTLLATGMFTGIGVAWLGSSVSNLIVAMIYTGAKKAGFSALTRRLHSVIPKKKLT